MTEQLTATPTSRRPQCIPKRDWLIPAGPVLLSVVTIAAGRIINLAVAEVAIRRSSLA